METREELSPNELIQLGKIDKKVRDALDLVRQAYDVLLSLDKEQRDMVEFNVQIGLTNGIRNRLGGSYARQCEKDGVKPDVYHLAPFEKFDLAIPTCISLNGMSQCCG
jgi:hypothetical protein